MTTIKTPDQRVRVFISSTINELAEERKAAREAINNLRLIPVYFEAGARPHPPRDLYSAYLDQSHIFAGIYWNSYGWTAPGSSISGLEDEYRLCGKKPKLIYLKNSNERQPKLNDLLRDIESSETACYQKFDTAEELQKMIENDLSVLMSEIFENALLENNADVIHHIKEEKKIKLPLIRSGLIGREAELNRITTLFQQKEISLVTILGAGGCGKTSIAIHAAHQMITVFSDGLFFIPLAPVTEAHLVAATIAGVLGLEDTGKTPIRVTLLDYLVDKNMLLILDNFEQIIEANDFISELIGHCKGIKILVTSRTPLHIRGEQIYQLPYLALPSEEVDIHGTEVAKIPAVALFITRAKEVNQQFIENAENLKAIATICHRLDGLPLAIELAASRTKLYQPSAILSRMDNTLDLLSKGHRDLPERQQTLRNTIEWSYNLLDDSCKKVFRYLGVFKRSWTLEAADAVINPGGQDDLDIEEITEKLLDVSLIRPVLVSHTSEPRFNMLQTVHAYANEILEESHELKEIELRFANYFLSFFASSENQLYGVNSEPWFDKIEYEFQNIRASFHIFLERKQFDKAWTLFYLLVPYWTVRGGYGEAEEWMKKGKIDLDPDSPDADVEKIDIGIKGKTYMQAAYIKLYLIQLEIGGKLVRASQKCLQIAGDEYHLAHTLAMDGGYGLYLQDPDGPPKLEQALLLAQKTKNIMAIANYLIWPAEYYRGQGMKERADEDLKEAFRICSENQLVTQLPLISMFRSNELIFSQRWQEAIELYNKSLASLPIKGYKGIKAGLWGGMSYCFYKLNKLDEAVASGHQCMLFIRECGEKESMLHSLIGSVGLLAHLQKPEVACKILGALDQFIESNYYPNVGSFQSFYQDAQAALHQDPTDSLFEKWREEGRSITLEQAVILVLENTKVG